MTDLEFRHDELLQRLGLVRGDAGNFDMRVESASLYSGSLIEFEAKGVTAIAVANNSGKTTLLNQIAAKLAQPDSGVKPELIAQHVY